MSENERSFFYSGHSIGAAAQFHRLDEVHNLNHVVPTLAGSALALTGGIAKSHVSHFCFSVDHPRRRTLLSVRRIDTAVAGRAEGNRFETDVEAEVEAIEVVEKLRIGLIAMHFLATRIDGDGGPKVVVSTRGTKIEGIELSGVKVEVTLDDDLLRACSGKRELSDYFRSQTADYRNANDWRFKWDPDAAASPLGHHRCTLVREIKITGAEKDKQDITVVGNTIVWKGFGRIVLAEVSVSDYERRLTMVRLAMGSDAGGGGTVACGRSNGQLGTS